MEAIEIVVVTPTLFLSGYGGSGLGISR